MNDNNSLQIHIYEELCKKWDMVKICEDLNDQKLRMEKHKQGLTETEKEYLYLLIDRYSPKDIENKNIAKTSSVKSANSRGLYEYIKEFIKDKGLMDTEEQDRVFKNWDWKDVRIFADDYYRRVIQEPLIEESKLPPAVGWIFLGRIEGSLEDSRSKAVEMLQTQDDPVTIIPSKLPNKRSEVTVNSPVNLREQSPQPPNIKLNECRIIKKLPIGHKLVILELVELDYPSNIYLYSKIIWAKVCDVSP